MMQRRLQARVIAVVLLGVLNDALPTEDRSSSPTKLGPGLVEPPALKVTSSPAVETERILGDAAQVEVSNLPGLDGGSGNYECPDKKCKHGGTLQNCKCICTNGWGGDRCQYCAIEGGGETSRRLLALREEDAVDSVDADGPTEGPLGEASRRRRRKKTKKPPSMGTCAHGTLDKDTCSCTCQPDWAGLQCDECKHEPCKNGGTLNTAACSCSCPGNWVGKVCDTCSITGQVPWASLFDPIAVHTAKQCHHGTFDASKCECGCDEDWAGNLCENCVHPACGAGGELDKLFCRCDCVPAWKGKTCEVCGHSMCKASKSTFEQANCDWVKNDLGCPSVGNIPPQPEKIPFPEEPSRSSSGGEL